jgi:hypothetical protein
MSEGTVIFLLMGLVITGGVVVIVSGMRHRARVLEMAHRERLMMIERGLPPATLPQFSSLEAAAQGRRPLRRSNRMLSGGIVIVGLGGAIAMLIGFASRQPEIAVGVGGAVAILGAAFIVTALVVHGPARAEAEARRDFDRQFPPVGPSSS